MKLFDRETPNLPLLIPAFIGVGVATYFSLPSEPSLYLAGGILLATGALLFVRRLWAVAIFLVALGFSAGVVRTIVVDTKMLPEKIRDAAIVGIVHDVEPREEGYRVYLHDTAYGNIRINADGDAPQIGRKIETVAALFPPFTPFVVGGFDFARHAYFHGISATGKMNGTFQYADSNETPDGGFAAIRQNIDRRINSILPRETAGIVESMTTGSAGGIPKPIVESYRAAGIAHVISISGFHMSVVAGLIFLIVRFLFSLSLKFSTRYNTKKVAAVIAIVGTALYLALSGARLPAQRSFIMTTLTLVAVILDRFPFSMRFVMVAATGMLLIAPESLLNPGFQMSFAAVAILVRLYESYDKWRLKNKILNAIWTNFLIAFLIDIALASIVIKSFNVVQPYGIIGNAFALPIVSIIVMPAIVAGLLLMPIGLDAIFFKIAGFGIEGVNFVAGKVAELPGASIAAHYMPNLSFALFAVGIVWLLVWSGRVRLFGIGSMIAAIVVYLCYVPPVAFKDSYGTLFGFRNGNTLLLVNKSKYTPNAIMVDAWRAKIGADKVEKVDETILFKEYPGVAARGRDGKNITDKTGMEFYETPRRYWTRRVFVSREYGKRPWHKQK